MSSKITKRTTKNGKRKWKSSSKGTRTTSTSLMRRRNIQAELEAHRKLAEIAKEELEIEKNLIQKELELNRLAELDDIQKGVESVVLEDFSNIKENISEDTSRRRRVKYDKIQQWVDTAPSDNSFNCDFSLKIRGKFEGDEFHIQNVRTMKNLDLPLESVDSKFISEKWEYLSPFQIHFYKNAKPKILLGQDNIDLIIARELIDNGKN
ncbi:hypothetical protein JTB14_019901 [Gonioctena quinquepunctata]|nr:hypothetical protein JTB14_019901 [Gonioctena quinquepunctata]